LNNYLRGTVNDNENKKFAELSFHKKHRIMKIFPIASLLLFLMSAEFVQPQTSSAQDLERYTFHSNHMGTRFTIILYSDNEDLANEASQAAFDRIEELNQLMSDYIEDSELNRLSGKSGSGKAMEISPDLFAVLQESINISEMTDGLFDVTIGPYTKLWRAVRMEPEPRFPDAEELHERGESVGYEHIKLNEENMTAELKASGMQLDLGGIAKGYASKEAINVLRDFGIYSALVDGGGDIALGTPPPERNFWEVAIPQKISRDETSHIMLNLHGKTVTTSGDMFQFIEIDGQRYSHILNPKTGLGATDQIQATVISSNAMYADALASVLTLMEPEEGIAFINQIDETEAYIMMSVEDGYQEWETVGFSNYRK
jgi:FAD:protein FMN transferase